MAWLFINYKSFVKIKKIKQKKSNSSLGEVQKGDIDLCYMLEY